MHTLVGVIVRNSINDYQGIMEAAWRLLQPWDKNAEVMQLVDGCACPGYEERKIVHDELSGNREATISKEKNGINPDCKYCEGAGKIIYWENRRGEWDECSIGGRFDGVLKGNENVKGFKAQLPLTGDILRQALKSPDGKLEDNICAVKDIPDSFYKFVSSILTPWGSWHGRYAGRGVWKEDDVWRAEVRKILSDDDFKDCVLVAVDCHY